MLLPVRKIDNTPEKDSHGAIKTNPADGKTLMGLKILEEAIDVNLIKGMRPFHKSGGKYAKVDEDITVVYLRSGDKIYEKIRDKEIEKDSERERVFEIHIIGNYEELVNQVNELRQKSGRRIMETD